MKDPRKEKLRNFRKGASQMRHARSYWRKCDELYFPSSKRVRIARAVRREHYIPKPELIPEEGAAALELYSQTGLIIEAGPNGSVSCRIKGEYNG